MGIALFTLTALFAPLQHLASRLLPSQSPPAASNPQRPSRLIVPTRRDAPRVARRAACPVGPAMVYPGGSGGTMARRAPALRVVRSMESDMPAGSTGRMVISGRMADVCAELERLAATEAPQ